MLRTHVKLVRPTESPLLVATQKILRSGVLVFLVAVPVGAAAKSESAFVRAVAGRF
jgi:hypothetical protein